MLESRIHAAGRKAKWPVLTIAQIRGKGDRSLHNELIASQLSKKLQDIEKCPGLRSSYWGLSTSKCFFSLPLSMICFTALTNIQRAQTMGIPVQAGGPDNTKSAEQTRLPRRVQVRAVGRGGSCISDILLREHHRPARC